MPAVFGDGIKSTFARSEGHSMTPSNVQRWKSVFLSVVLLFSVVPLAAGKPEPSFDIVIANGRIIDGTGSPHYSGEIGIHSRKIFFLGHPHRAPRHLHIAANRFVVAPV